MQQIKLMSILLAAAVCASGQTGRRAGTTFVTNSMGFLNGVTAKATVAVEPQSPLTVFENKSFGISTTTGENYHRWIVDDSKRGYFGYDIRTERIENSDQIRVTIGPLTLTTSQLDTGQDSKKDPGLRFVVLPKYPTPFLVKSGDTIAIDLLVSADGRQKIVDYIQISSGAKTDPRR